VPASAQTTVTLTPDGIVAVLREAHIVCHRAYFEGDRIAVVLEAGLGQEWHARRIAGRIPGVASAEYDDLDSAILYVCLAPSDGAVAP